MDLLAHLEAYVAAVDEASFSRAAERLGIAQPLLSRRIKMLEEHFGGQLFDRSRRQVETTELGHLLLPYAQDVLDRAQRLGHVARSARQSAVHAVGVPADCGPAALARIIRAGAERDVTFAVRELPPDERVAGLADTSLAYALVRVAPENAALRVPLGLASAPPQSPDGAAAAPSEAHRRTRRRAIHLEDLRPRRGVGAPRERRAAVPILAMAEDQLPTAQDRLRRAVARAGLPEGTVRPAGPTATALAETLAGQVTLLCTEPFARRHGANWAPLDNASLHRGYDAGAARRPGNAAHVPDWLVPLLAAAVGAAATVPTTASVAAGEDAPSRLAARG
ncbi:LysR family transcriptional regulator [Streptomyces sp. GS7]|uniref:LysR family transcriptional regulator n=1 Tax=Streptomyces sp. GS7 TaxID=2692234 RepID=UPI001319A1EB|nr:LysR family transcriptional regulator [Streptomyces sp. GS7]QHC22817.1 LysR family transcriptional regulator [Streptomyces sp. GS7]